MDYARRQHHEMLAHLLLVLSEEEESSIYGMSMLSKNKEHLDLFGPDQKKVVRILDILVADTQKHQKLLVKAAELVLKGLV